MKRRIVEKPWGFEHIWAETEDYVAKMLHINPKQRLSLQYHETKEETVYVLEGTLLNWTDDDDSPRKDTMSTKCCTLNLIKYIDLVLVRAW